MQFFKMIQELRMRKNNNFLAFNKRLATEAKTLHQAAQNMQFDTFQTGTVFGDSGQDIYKFAEDKTMSIYSEVTTAKELRDAFPDKTDEQLLEDAIFRIRYLDKRLESSRKSTDILQKKINDMGFEIRAFYRKHFQ